MFDNFKQLLTIQKIKQGQNLKFNCINDNNSLIDNQQDIGNYILIKKYQLSSSKQNKIGMIQSVQTLVKDQKIVNGQEQIYTNERQCFRDQEVDKNAPQINQKTFLTYSKSMSAQLTNNQLTSNQTNQQTNLDTNRPNRYSICQKNGSSDEGQISGRIQNVKSNRKQIVYEERQSAVSFQDVFLIEKPENTKTNTMEYMQGKQIKEQVNFQQSTIFNKPLESPTAYRQQKQRQTLRRGSIKQLKHLMPEYNQNFKIFQQGKPLNQAINKNECKCYLQLFQNKWQKVDLKISKNKINIGPVNIDVSKILKIKIFPSEITEESQQNIKSSGFDENQMKRRFGEKEEQKSKMKKPLNKIDKFFKKKLFGQEAKSNSQENIQQDDVPDEGTILKINKKNLLKLTTQNNNIYQFYQIYPTIILGQPKQTFSFSTLPQPQTPNIGLSSRLPAPFISFSRIILKKLKQLYPHIKSTIWQQPQYPIRAIIYSEGQFNNNLLNKGKGTKNYAYIHGVIYKKSQIKGKWEKRYVIINQKGLFSYKEEKDEGYSFSISCKNIKYMWTWFNVLKIDQQQGHPINGETSDKQTQKIQPNQKEEREGEGEKQKSRETSPIQPNKQLYLSDSRPIDPFLSRISSENQPLQQKEQNQNLINLEEYKSLMKTEFINRQTQQINDNKNFYLIIKLKHGFNNQTQFAIPICGFDNEINKSRNWLFAFYKIASQYQF